VDVQDGSAAGKLRSDNSSAFVRDLGAWAAICDRLYIWDYTVNFANYAQPFPNLHVLQPNLRLFKKYGVRGVLEQGNFSPGAASGLAALKVYLLAKLLWDPDGDLGAWTDDFIAGVYGKAAPYLHQYIALLTDAVRSHHMNIYDASHAPYFTDEVLERADALFVRAEAAAETEEIRSRVALERLSVTYTRLARLPLNAPDRDALWDAFHADTARFGITELFERRPLDASIERLKQSRYALDRTELPYLDYRL
ncbi:MAG: DUF4838 domain-containing protein, partial [Clostridia bacterium]|nr:DUF4838 domain-containing protein [Clostridia bacterium]